MTTTPSIILRNNFRLLHIQRRPRHFKLLNLRTLYLNMPTTSPTIMLSMNTTTIFNKRLNLRKIFNINRATLRHDDQQVTILIIFRPAIGSRRSYRECTPSSSRILVRRHPMISSSLSNCNRCGNLYKLKMPNQQELQG